MNTGKAIPGQQAGETDDEYRQRLIDIGDEVLDDDEVEREAGLLQTVKAKYNLKEFLSDEGKIETIIKKLNNDERTLFNTKIAAIKKKYLDTYGFNNSNMTVDKIAGFIKEQIAEPTPAQPTPAPQIALPDDLVNLLRQQAAGQPQAPEAPIQEAAAPPQAVLINKPKAINSFDKAELIDIAARNNITFTETNPSKEVLYTKLLQQSLIPVSKRATPTIGAAAAAEPEIVFPPPPRRSDRLNQTDQRSSDLGLGVHLKKLPKVIKLGHIHINPSTLYYEHILSVRNPKNKPLRAYKDEHVSVYLASLLIKLIEGGTIKKYELQPLNDHEKMIYDNLIKRSKLHTMNDNTFESTALKMKDRLLVLEGELEAGNTNPAIKSEIHGLLFK